MAKDEATLVVKVKNIASKPLKVMAKGVFGLSKAVNKTIKSFKSFGSSLKKSISDRLVITAGDVVNALKAMGGAIIDFAKTAAEFKTVESAFKNLAASQGQDADKMLSKMRELSLGTVSDLKLMKSANQALLLGLPVDKFGDMLTIARSASKATGESMEFMLNSIVTGLGRGSKLVLDNLGIVFKLEDAYAEYAATLGKTSAELTEAEKKQAFINKALEIGVKNSKAAGDQQLNLTDRMDQANAAFENASIVIGDMLLPAFKMVVIWSTKLIKSISGFASENKVALKGFFGWVAVETLNFIDGFMLIGKNLGVAAAGIAATVGAAMTGNFTQAKNFAKMTLAEIDKNNMEANDKAISRKKELISELATMEGEAGELELKRQRAIMDQKLQAELEEHEAKLIREQEAEVLALEKSERELAAIGASDEQKLDFRLKYLDKLFKTEKTHEKKMSILKEKSKIIEQQKQAARDKIRVNTQKSTLGTIATLHKSNNSTLRAIGSAGLMAQKAMAIKEIAIQTPVAISKTLAAFPYPFNLVAAAGVGIAMAAQAANVAGVQLAEGGIVQATPGGIQATIGEGGRDEAVIPLDDAGGAAGGIGTTVNLTVNGGLLGDESSAKELAIAIDSELFKLRQSNESVSFDDGIL